MAANPIVSAAPTPCWPHAQSDRATFRFRHGTNQRRRPLLSSQRRHLRPHISSVDILSAPIFASNNTGENGGHAHTASSPRRLTLHLAILSTTTAAATVLDNGLLATVTLDTTGFAGNGFSLAILGTVTATVICWPFRNQRNPDQSGLPSNQYTITPTEPATSPCLPWRS